MSALHRRAGTAFAVAAVLVGSIAPSAGAGTVASDYDTAVRDIVFPIAGAGTYSDTFGACRSGCTRGHEGTDIMAPKLSKAIAVRDAHVSWLRDSATPDGSRGNMLVLRDSQGWEYWYIHINNDSPGTDDGKNPKEWIFPSGIEVGTTVVAGQHVAYVGDSGNAEGSGSHLHFEIHKPDGTIINPYKSLRAAPRLSTPVAAGSSIAGSPQGRFVQALYIDFLDRVGSQSEIVAGVDRLATTGSRAAVVDGFANSDEWIRALLDGYYRSTLGRPADASGRGYWTGVIRAGATPADVASEFYASDEYYERSGGSDTAWIRDLYDELLRRPADASGLAFWRGELDRGVSRASVAYWFYQSLESRRVRVAGLYGELLGRRPDRGGHAYWADVLMNGRDIELATFLAASDEYYRRAGRRFS